MTETKRQSLSVDLDSLFPGESLTLGNASIIIRPLGLEQISTISKQLEGFGSILKEKGVTWDNYNAPASMFSIAMVLLSNFSDILEEAANVRIEDLKVLPIEAIVMIVEKIIAVNLKSKEDLEKNFKSLAENFLQDDKSKKVAPLPIPKKKKI